MDIRYEGADAGAPVSTAGADGSADPRRLGSRTAALGYARSLPAQPRGSLLALFLGKDFDLLASDLVGRGSLADCVPKPLLLVRRGLELGAAGMVLVHHSPDQDSDGRARSGLTVNKLRRAGEDFEVHLLDYLILSGAGAGSG